MRCSPISCLLLLWCVNSMQQSESVLSSSGSHPWLLNTVPVWCSSARSCWVQYRASHKQRWSWSSHLLFQWENPNQDIHGNWASTLCQHSLQVVPGVVSDKYVWWSDPSLNPYLTCLPMSLRWILVSELCGTLKSMNENLVDLKVQCRSA